MTEKLSFCSDHLYLDFGSGAGLFTATFGEEGSSAMVEGWAAEAADVTETEEAAWFFSDLSALSDLSDLEERLMRFRNPPLLFFFSPSCDSELFKERLRGDGGKNDRRMTDQIW